ncbi:hypothetical protein OG21DRAFT_1600940 [Imleria badia]|nr:hypothetical protein OG21DRAFT_1600940 [Imleria badia]
MHAFSTVASLALLASRGWSTLQDGMAGVDDGETPLLSSIGECEIGFYMGDKYTLAQTLPSVNVDTTSNFTFTPNPAAGPDGKYYIIFSADSINYRGFSGTFTLKGISGTFQIGNYGRRGH